MPFTFLSDEWLAEAKSLLESSGSSGMMPAAVSLNLVVTGGPQGDRELHAADGAFGAGLLADAPTKLTLPYAVARKMFIEGDQQAAMQAFMSGQIKVEGDMTKLMALQGAGGGASAEQKALQEKLKALTA